MSRFIPACAGNAPATSGYPQSVSVHPRLCGERCHVPAAQVVCVGSSPPVRGTPPVRLARRSSRRFIPACAGNAQTCSAINTSETVHPRLCGERKCRSKINRAVGGSSPPVRGTHVLIFAECVQQRFIPACAGNAGMLLEIIRVAPVHPRLCGERHKASRRRPSFSGSSPPVRGTPCRRIYRDHD